MSVEIVKVGKWQSPVNRECKMNSHIHRDYHQLIFTQNSIGKLVQGGAECPYKPEHLYFTPPSVLHECVNSSKTQYIIFYFKVLSEPLRTLIDSLPPEVSPRDLMSCKQLLSQAAYEFSSGTSFGTLRANAYFELFLSASLDSAPKLFSAADTGDVHISALSERGVDLVANFIYNNFSNEISIDDLVSISHFERRQFFRVFKEKFGTTPNKYINELRMNKAKSLLVNTNMSISEISENCGFKTEHYFSRAFKERESISPQEFRRNAAKTEREVIF